MKKIFSATLLFLFPIAVLAAPELSGTPYELSQYLLDQKKIISIQGDAEEKVEADTAIVAIAVRTKESKLTQALEKNEAIRKQLKEALQKDGVSGDKIKASKFSSTPNYSWYKDKPSSYEVSNEIKITVADETQLQAIARLVDGQKEVFLGSTEFEDSAKDANKQKALEKALNEVQTKRALYEKNLGINLTPVRISGQNVYAQTPQVRRAVKQFDEADSLSIQSASVAEAPEASSDFGAITYRANTVVEFIVKEANNLP